MKYYKFDELKEDAQDKAFVTYCDRRADKAYERELPDAVEGMNAFMDSIHEWTSLPDWGGVFLKCGFAREDFEHIQFDVRANDESSNSYEWELANLYNGLMNENMGLFRLASKIDEWYWDWRVEHDWWDDERFSDLHSEVTKRVEDKYEEILDEVANLMEGLAEGIEGEYYERYGYFECLDAPTRRYHEDGRAWTVRDVRRAA